MNIFKRSGYYNLICFFLISSNTFSQDFSFQDGDRICFVGNSITMSGSFHQYINLFYVTRFPQRKISFFNSGISGEQAVHMLKRLDSDILINKPTWCVLMVGSNDINEQLYSETNKSIPGIEEKKQEALDKYYHNMTLLIEKLLAANVKVILEIPCIYDQTGKLRAENYFGANDALGKCGDFLKQASKKYGLLLVDYWSITKEINKIIQSRDSTASIIGNDRSHPGKYGNFVMAYQFLKTQLKTSVVSEITLDIKNHRQNRITGSIVGNINRSKNGVCFISVSNSLPFPVPDKVQPDSLVQFTNEFNLETIRIRGLDKGRYNFFIDSILIGEFQEHELAVGINLSGNQRTPQFVQALQVLNLFNQYWKTAADLRAIKYVEYQHMRTFHNRDDMVAVKNFFDSALIRHKDSDNFNFFTNMFKKYMLLKPNEEKLVVNMNDQLNKIYELNKPRQHLYKIEQVNR